VFEALDGSFIYQPVKQDQPSNEEEGVVSLDAIGTAVMEEIAQANSIIQVYWDRLPHIILRKGEKDTTSTTGSVIMEPLLH
jgi:hypothetical protein